MLIVLGIATIFVAITVMGKLMKSLMVGRAREILKNAIGRGPIHGIASGSIVILVQSSSTTTSLMVPLVGSGVLKVRDAYPFTLGANIGMCITALLAATAVSGEFAVFALQIALVHLVFNIMVTVFIFIPFSTWTASESRWYHFRHGSENKAVVAGYLVAVFLVLPGSVLNWRLNSKTNIAYSVPAT